VFGVGRTYRGHHETDATDPKRACNQLAAATAKVLPTPFVRPLCASVSLSLDEWGCQTKR
jgi:hypothetical protein